MTIDAMGYQKSIASKIREKKGNYVLSLKGNHGDLHDDVRTYFDGAEKTSLKRRRRRASYSEVYLADILQKKF